MPRRYIKKSKRSVKNSLTDNQKKAVRKIAKQKIYNVLRPELKYVSYTLLQAAARLATNGTASLIDDLTGPAAGYLDSQRIGDQLTLKSLTMRIAIEALSTYVSGCARVFIFQWHTDSANQLPTIPLLYMSSVSGSADALSPYNMDSHRQGNITVLYDRIHNFVSSADNDFKAWTIKVPIKYAKKTIHFNSGLLTGRDHIFCVVNADKAGVGTNALTYYFTSRLTFTDA